MFEIWGQKQLSLSARVNAPASFRLVLLNLKITFLVTRSEGLHVCESRPPPMLFSLAVLITQGLGNQIKTRCGWVNSDHVASSGLRCCSSFLCRKLSFSLLIFLKEIA